MRLHESDPKAAKKSCSYTQNSRWPHIVSGGGGGWVCVCASSLCNSKASEGQLNKKAEQNTEVTWRKMEELHRFPEFPGRSLCFHFIQNMELSWFIGMVRHLFPASTVQFAVNCCFMPKIFATFHYTWNVKHFYLLLDVSGQQNFVHEVVLGYKEILWFNIHALLLPSERKTRNCQNPLISLTRAFIQVLHPCSV